MASATISVLTSNETCLLLMLDAADLMAFDTANQCNRWMLSAWLEIIRCQPDLRPLTGLLYSHFWIRWIIDRGARTSSMHVVQSYASPITDTTFTFLGSPVSKLIAAIT